VSTQHPITPPPKLVNKWEEEWNGDVDLLSCIATRAAQWGADQELEACCEWVEREIGHGREWNTKLRAARRPKPPSLKEQALEAWEIANQSWTTTSDKEVAIIIRRALEALND